MTMTHFPDPSINKKATMTTPRVRKQIRTKIYACGGFALKMLGFFQEKALADELTHLEVNYIDTADSDVPVNINAEDVYFFKNMDGGGKNRRVVYTTVIPHIPALLEAMPASDFNIVVHSCSGGSGSAIGPALVSELLRAGKHVVVVQIGSTGSKIEVQNTIGTIKSYANISNKTGRPVISYYRENNEKATRSQVDSQVQSALFMLGLLFSSESDGLDTADLQNLLDYNKVTSFDPVLSTFDFHCQKISLPENLVAQAAAVLFSRGADSTDGHENGSTLLEYRAEGFLSDKRSQQLDGRAPIYFVAYTGDFSARLVELETRLKKFEIQAKAAQTSNLAVTLAMNTNDDDLVF